MQSDPTQYLFCDAHVHCYQIEDLPFLLDQAWKNLNRAALSEIVEVEQVNYQYYLVLTDGETDQGWSYIHTRLSRRVDEDKADCIGGWSFSFSKDMSLINAQKENQRLTLVPGRQINSKNRLEYLLLGCSKKIEHSLDDDEIIQKYSQQYVLVCPWGVGKWLGSRGRLLDRLIRQNPNDLKLADNGGRPRIWSRVKQFSSYKGQFYNGSDPLPLAGLREVSRVGSYGFRCESANNPNTLTEFLQILRSSKLQSYGQRLGLFYFLKTRLLMMLRSRS